MYRLLLILIICSFSIENFAQFETKLSNELFISKLSDQVYIVTHNLPWESNSLIIKNSDNEIALIDTPYDSASTALLLQWIEQVIAPKKIIALNTGFHIDNLGGNSCLRTRGIDVYGSDRTVALVESNGQKTTNQIITWLKPEQDSIKRIYESMSLVKPNIIFSLNDGLKIPFGNLELEVYFPGETHSPDNTVVYVKELKLLFAGCLAKALSYTTPGFTGDANMAEWPGSLQNVLNKFSETKIVIPHHGMWGDMNIIYHTIDLLQGKK